MLNGGWGVGDGLLVDGSCTKVGVIRGLGYIQSCSKSRMIRMNILAGDSFILGGGSSYRMIGMPYRMLGMLGAYHLNCLDYINFLDLRTLKQGR